MPKIKRTVVVEDDHPFVAAPARVVEENVAKLLGADTDKPWCTCGQSGSFTFDQQLGMYVHVNDKTLCYKPSKAYYAAAVEAGIVRE